MSGLRYDVCIIGAGAEGLTSAVMTARAGFKTVVVERLAAAGGRCVTREFLPGFFASPFIDELPAIPPEIFRRLDLARHGAILTPASGGASTAADEIRAAVIARVLADAAKPLPRFRFRRLVSPPWPGEALATRATVECSGTVTGDSARGALAMLAGPPGGMPRGGLGCLGAAFAAAATAAGAEILCGLDVTDIRRRGGRVCGVGLSDGSEIATRAVISTLDVKRTFLTLFAWNDLPKSVVERVGAFRAAPGVARLLLALETLPRLPKSQDREILRRPVVLATATAEAFRAAASGTVADRPPAVVRFVSAIDPSLAPDGACVATMTLEAVPFAPFDGPWTPDKRNALRIKALLMLEQAFPGIAETVKAAVLIVPPDIEEQLGLTQGDLSGGALMPSQMLSFRPFAECSGTRTPVAGLYLAGPSSALGPLATSVSGWAAATAVCTDLGRAG